VARKKAIQAMSEYLEQIRECAHCRAHPFALCDVGVKAYRAPPKLPDYDAGYADAIADDANGAQDAAR
jgi:hypothetical protein